jgi:hypothetical protein
MATVNYELTYTDQVETVRKIRFNNVTLQGPTLKQDFLPVNTYKNAAVKGIVCNGFTISIAVEAIGTPGGMISLKVEVDGKKTVIYPIRKNDVNGVYSFSFEYNLKP